MIRDSHCNRSWRQDREAADLYMKVGLSISKCGMGISLGDQVKYGQNQGKLLHTIL